jgi:hypothetical protein
VVKKLKEIIEPFYMAIFMKINIAKSTISFWGILELEKNYITHLFPYNLDDLAARLKY